MPLSSTNRTRLRGARHIIVERAWNCVPKTILASAQVNGTPARTSFPIQQLSLKNTSGSWGSLEDGMLVLIGTTAGAWDVCVGVVADGTDATTLKLDEKSYGDPGMARNIVRPIQDNDYISVIKWFPVVGRLSRIRGGVQYKKGNVPYTNQNHDPSPVAKMGGWRRERVNPVTNVARVAFDAMPTAPAPGYPDRRSFAYGTKTISSYQWSIDGTTLAAGYSLTDSAIEIDAAPGFYLITVTVFDSAGRQHKRRTPLWVRTASGSTADFSARYLISDFDVDLTRKGGEAAITIYGESAIAELFPFQGWFYSETAYFDGLPIDGDEILVDSFVGYADEEGIDHSRSTGATKVTIRAPMKMIDALATAPQLLKEARVPRDWQQIAPAYSHVGFVIDHLLRWHFPALFDNHDFILPGGIELLRKFSWETGGTSLSAHLTLIEQMGLLNIGSLSDGSTLVCFDPMMQEDAERDALDSFFTWTTQDIVGRISVRKALRAKVRWATVYAMQYNGAETIPLAARAPGGAAAQGISEPNLPIVLIPASRGQFGVQQIAGHLFARNNREYDEISFEANRNLAIIEPANLMRWHVLDVEDKGRTFLYRMLPQSVKISYRKGVKRVTFSCEIESDGLPGEILPIERGGAAGYSNGSWVDGEQGVYSPSAPQFNLEDIYGIAVAVNRAGKVGRSLNFLDQRPRWKSITGYTGEARDLYIDPTSDLVNTGEGTLKMWGVAVDTTAALGYIFAIADATASEPAASATYNFSASSTMHDVARIFAPTPSTYMLVGWKDDAGSYVLTSTNGGSAWSQVSVGATTGGTVDNTELLGMDVYGTQCAIIAPKGTTGADGKKEYGVYYRASGTGGFGLINGIPLGWRVVPGCLLFTSSGAVLWCVLEKLWTEPPPITNITFDIGGFDEYTVSSFGSSGEMTLLAYPERGSVAWGGTNGTSPSVSNVSVAVDLGDEHIVESVSYKRLFQNFPSGTVTFTSRVDYYDSADVLVFSETLDDLTYDAGDVPASVTDEFYTRTTTQRPEVPVTLAIVRVEVSSTVSSLGVAQYVDDILVTATPVQKETVRSLYSIAGSFTGLPTWSAKESQERVPLHHYALHNDAANAARFEMIGSADDGTKLRMAGVASGSTWSSRGRGNQLTGVKRSGDAYLTWGAGDIYLSDDGGETIHSRIGDFTSAVGAVDTIDGVWVVL